MVEKYIGKPYDRYVITKEEEIKINYINKKHDTYMKRFKSWESVPEQYAKQIVKDLRRHGYINIRIGWNNLADKLEREEEAWELKKHSRDTNSTCSSRKGCEHLALQRRH